MKRTVLAVALALACLGCTGDPESSPPPEETPTPTESASEDPTSAPGSIERACTDLVEGLPFTPNEQTLNEFVVILDDYQAEGDAETKAALAPMAATTDQVLAADGTEAVNDALSEHFDALNTFKDNCRNVG